MKTVGVFEGKARFSALIVDAQRGETTIITRNGEPVAEIGPVKSYRLNSAKQVAQNLRALHARLKAEGRPKRVDIRALIDEDRK